MVTLPSAQALRMKRPWAKQAAACTLFVCLAGTSLTGGALSQSIAGVQNTPPAISALVKSGFAGLDVPGGARPLPHGYLRVSSSQIVEQAGKPVRLACVGYFAPKNVGQDIPAIAAAGFNCIRYPWYNATLPDHLPVMDAIVKAAGMAGLKVIFDHHGDETPSAANNYLPYPCNGLPIDKGSGTNQTDGCGDAGSVDVERFVADWARVAARYAGNSVVIGFDLTNEPHFAPTRWRNGGGATWGDGSATDLKHLYELAGDAILRVNPDVLVICEGIGRFSGRLYDGTPLATSGVVDLSFVSRAPVTLMSPGHVVYSVHDYPATIGNVSPDWGPVKVGAMNAAWGHLMRDHIAPVWVGEMGASLDGAGPDSAGSKLQAELHWAETITGYINGDFGSQGGPVFAANEEPVSTSWWAWGNLDGQSPDGTLDGTQRLRAAQWAVYGRLRPKLGQAPRP